jgi:hypothetical protein
MATLRSSDAPLCSTVRVRIFSGRPDPTWCLPEREAATLLTMWHSLSDIEPGDQVDSPAALGYRGCIVGDGGGRTWTVHGQRVSLQQEGRREVLRRDPERKFERALLASAPPGLLPTGLLPE